MFARATGLRPGVYFDPRLGSRTWLTAPIRLTGHPRDASPLVALDSAGRTTVVFER